MTKLKVGDRVRLRGYSYGGKDVDGLTGEVEDVVAHGDVNVRLDGSGEVLVKPSQIKSRLVKKPRREWWLTIHDCSRPRVHKQHEPGLVCGSGCKIEWVQVREVRGKASKA